VDEVGYTCSNHVGYDCTAKNKYINSFGYTPEGWKKVLDNCPVSCSLCDSGAFRSLEDDVSEPKEETPSSGMCMDTAGYVDSQGNECSSNIGFDCLKNEMLYTEEWGYSLDDWIDIVESCPKSCGLCESSGGIWSAVPQPFTVMSVLVYSHTLMFPMHGCLLMNGPMLVTFAFTVFVLVIGDIETPPTLICSESCEYSKDGYCDDGGFGSNYSECALGTDCEVWLTSKNSLSKQLTNTDHVLVSFQNTEHKLVTFWLWCVFDGRTVTSA
jgi:hypothetical protein